MLSAILRPLSSTICVHLCSSVVSYSAERAMIPKLALESTPARTIDEVIEQLNDIINRTRQEQSRLGFFAALYRVVTIKVKEGISAVRFDDGARMEQLDVTFANRYLDALQRFRRKERP